MGRPVHFEAVLFDMDGTTIDSEGIKNEQLAELLRSYGADVCADELAFVSGMDLEGLLEALGGILTRFGVQADPLSVLQSMPYGREAAYLHPDCKPIDGVIPFLKRLREQGILCALVSNTPSYAVLTALDRFHMVGMFDVVVCGDMISVHKPSPEGFLRAAELLCVEPSRCAVIEDSTSGVIAGHAAEAYVFARDDGAGVFDLTRAHETFRAYDELVLW